MPVTRLKKLKSKLIRLKQTARILDCRLKIALNLNKSDRYLRLGKILLKLDRRDESVIAFENCIQQNPGDFRGYSYLGETLTKDGKYVEAISNLQQAIKLNPEHAWSYFHLGQAYLKLNQFLKANANLQRAIELNYQDNFLQIRLKQAIAAQQRRSEIEHLQNEIKLDSENCHLLYKLGLALYQQERWEEATKYLSRHISLKSDNYHCYELLAQIQDKLYEQSNSETVIQQTVSKFKTLNQQLISVTHPHFRSATVKSSALKQPEYFIIGQRKCGTTSLYNYLIHHPQIVPALKKEVHFWDNNFHKGYDWYSAHFPNIDSKQNFITGEATPNYINSPLMAKKIIKYNSLSKIIILLRNPVDRTISDYYMEHRRLREFRSLEAAIISEIDSILDLPEGKREKRKVNRYFAESQYINLLRPWLKTYETQQLLILKSEDLFANPEKTVNRVFNFLGVESYQLEKYRQVNSGSYNEISQENRRLLEDYFRPYNQQLENYLKRNFNWY